VSGAGTPIVSGMVDREGRLIAADPRLLALQLGAGGEPGGMFVVPSLASLARLARNLGVLVSRSVVAADGEHDLDLWVRARLDGDSVALSIAGWDERPGSAAGGLTEGNRLLDFAELESEGAWACDAHLRFKTVDAELVAMAGLSARDIADQPLTRLFKLVETEAGDIPLLEGVSLRQPFSGQIAELRALPDVRVALHGAPAIAPSGEFAGFSGGYRLTGRLLPQPRTPSTPSAAVGAGLAERLNVALREPIGRIIDNADQIGTRSEGPLRQDYAGYAQDIASAGRHLLGLVDDLIDLQAVERPDFTIEAESIDLADIARRAAGLLGVRARDRSVKIDPPADDEALPVRGDFRRALQIMVNLVGNAVRYSPEGSSVWLRCEEEGDLAAVIVADQGKGIDPTDHDRIFAKFERVDQSEPGGSGLGLYISRQLARAMGGDITVDSAPGQGARFVLTLPSANAS
jgi:Histidine kinase-, DNA gyrase B-, and HSP90-like ATPase